MPLRHQNRDSKHRTTDTLFNMCVWGMVFIFFAASRSIEGHAAKKNKQTHSQLPNIKKIKKIRIENGRTRSVV